MGTWAWALLMCPGGPNHCKVGRAGSHSYSSSVECHTFLPGAWCSFMLGRYVCCGMSCMRCVHCRVAMLSIMSLLPSYTHTQILFFLHLLCEACCRNKMWGSLQRWTYKSMKLGGSSLSNIQTISAISWCHRGMLAIWISFDVIQHTNWDNLDMERLRSWVKSWFAHPWMSRG